MDRRNAGPLAALALWASLSGCASHLITAGRDDGVGRGDLPFTTQQLSIAGEVGANSDGAAGKVATECGGEPLTRVEMHRSFGQGVITVLTLGIVSPVTIRFFCAAPTIPEGNGVARDGF